MIDPSTGLLVGGFVSKPAHNVDARREMLNSGVTRLDGK